jgi:hypothetical protein
VAVLHPLAWQIVCFGCATREEGKGGGGFLYFVLLPFLFSQARQDRVSAATGNAAAATGADATLGAASSGASDELGGSDTDDDDAAEGETETGSGGRGVIGSLVGWFVGRSPSKAAPASP